MDLLLNGALYTDLLNGASIIAKDFNGTDWLVVARIVGKDLDEPFTEYQTDEWGDFQIVERHSGSQPTVLRRVLDKFRGITPPEIAPRGRPKKEKILIKPGKKKITAGEWVEMKKEGKL